MLEDSEFDEDADDLGKEYKAESWPFTPEPPPLQVTRRGGFREEQAVARALASVPSTPSTTPSASSPTLPPLEIRRRGQDSNRGSQTGSLEPVATQVPKNSSSGSQVPQNASKPHSPPPLPVSQPSSSRLQQVEHVYVVVGMDMDQGMVSLCRIVTDVEFVKAKRGLNNFFQRIIEADYSKLPEQRGMEQFDERRHLLKILPRSISPQNKALGVVLQFDLYDQGDPVWEERPLDVDDDEDEDEDGDRMQLVGYEGAYTAYSWAVIKCKLGELQRLDLSKILDE